jgi:predicted acetylornithine/succinylornithine family transaminase
VGGDDKNNKISIMISDLFTNENKFFLQTYKRTKLKIVSGDGIFLVDNKNSRYMDFFSGLAVNALGYTHPKIVAAVTNQITKFAHLSNYYVTDVQNQFAEKLLKLSGMNKLFLTNSGTEATEAAIKLIRKKFGPNNKIFSLSNNFHGRTYGALSITDRPKYKNGFEPLLQNCETISFNDVSDLKLKVNEDAAAIFIEFIQGEGGINEVSEEFVTELNLLKQKFNFIVVADEIQSGIGRTGKNFAFNYYNILPDLVLVAKAIGGGLPLGAVLVSEDLSNTFSYGEHGTTFGGNPVSCAAGLVVLEEIFDNGLLQKVYERGYYFKSRLFEIKNKFNDKIKDVRGKGFMLGVELSFTGQVIVDEMLKRKILTNCTNTNVIRILPPLIAEKEHIDHFLKNFEEVISTLIQ